LKGEALEIRCMPECCFHILDIFQLSALVSLHNWAVLSVLYHSLTCLQVLNFVGYLTTKANPHLLKICLAKNSLSFDAYLT